MVLLGVRVSIYFFQYFVEHWFTSQCMFGAREIQLRNQISMVFQCQVRSSVGILSWINLPSFRHKQLTIFAFLRSVAAFRIPSIIGIYGSRIFRYDSWPGYRTFVLFSGACSARSPRYVFFVDFYFVLCFNSFLSFISFYCINMELLLLNCDKRFHFIWLNMNTKMHPLSLQ